MSASRSRASADSRLENPLVTVITPAHNVAPYLEHAMTSALRQTYENLEYLVVDDGSTDGSAEIAAAVAARDRRVRTLVEPHRGSGAARNAGLTAARGRYVAFLDGDDLWRPDFLRTMIGALEAASLQTRAVFCRSQHFCARPGDMGLQPFAPGPYGVVEMLTAWNPTGNGSCLLLRRDDFDSTCRFDERLPSCVDLDMWLRILAARPDYRFVGLDDVLVDYRRRTDSISADSRGRFDALYRITRDHGSGVPRMRRRSYSYLVELGYRSDRPREALHLYGAAAPWALYWAVVDPGWRRANAYAALALSGPRVEKAARRVRAGVGHVRTRLRRRPWRDVSHTGQIR